MRPIARIVAGHTHSADYDAPKASLKKKCFIERLGSRLLFAPAFMRVNDTRSVMPGLTAVIQMHQAPLTPNYKQAREQLPTRLKNFWGTD
jgi:hypothetical protein